MLHHGSFGASLKQNKRSLKKPNPNPNSERSSIFYCFVIIFIIKFKSLSDVARFEFGLFIVALFTVALFNDTLALFNVELFNAYYLVLHFFIMLCLM